MKKKIPQECVESVIYPKIVLEENGRKITFKNNKVKIKKVRVDGCAIKENIVKCDWLLIRPDKKEFFVELKGKNLDHAFKQIELSIKMISDKPKIGINIYIVISRSPNTSTQIQVKTDHFRKNYNVKKLLVKENMPEIDIQTA